jgi:hypothetical protein
MTADQTPQPSLREDAMYAMGYQRGVKDGWNLCVANDQEGYARAQQSCAHVRALKDTVAAQPADSAMLREILRDLEDGYVMAPRNKLRALLDERHADSEAAADSAMEVLRQSERAMKLALGAIGMMQPCADGQCKAEQAEWKAAAERNLKVAIERALIAQRDNK